MLVNRAALSGITTGFNTIFNKAFGSTKPLWSRVATEVKSTGSEEGYKWLGMIPRLKEWIGEKEIQNLEAADYTIKNKDFELTIGVDRNDIEDDKLGLYTPVITDMGQQGSMFPDTLVFAVLKQGFTKPCYDGKNFFAADHKMGKQVLSNLGTKKLTQAAYQAARTKMMSLVDGNKNPLGIIPDLLVVPPALESAAKLILEADQINGTTNTTKGTAELLVCPELAGADDAWYLLSTTRAVKPLIFQNRKPAKFVSLTNDTDENVFMQKQYLYSVEARGNSGFALWQLAFGSTGTEA